MKPRYKTKLDANHAEIKNYLEEFGVEVIDCSASGELPDLLIFDKHGLAWLEVKIVGSNACFTKPQLQFIAKTKSPVGIVKTKEEAIAYSRTRAGLLSPQAKYRLGVLAETTKTKLITPTAVDAMIAKG